MQVTQERQWAAQILGVAPEAEEKAVKRAYHQAVRTAHPDAGGSGMALRQVTAAAEVLLDRASTNWVQSADGLPAAASNPAASASPREEVQRPAGPVAWVRSVVQLRLMAWVFVWSALAVAAASAGFSVVAMPMALALAGMMLAKAAYGAFGRPQWQHLMARRHASVDDGTEWPTGPIPVMTDERMRQYERTGR